MARAAASPMRTPVKAPGPTVTAIICKSAKPFGQAPSAAAKTSATIGISASA